jgi:hypothetical protein
MIVTIISYIEDYENYTFDRRIDLIFSIDDNFYELTEDLNKLSDVDKMPDYIKNDWFKYNGFTLTEKTLNKHIDKVEKLKDNLEILTTLKAIKRNFRIDSIL